MEGHAGTGRVESGAGDESALLPEPSADESAESQTGTDQQLDTPTEDPAPAPAERPPSRVGRRWLTGICAATLLLAGGVATGGYFALRGHQQSQAFARDNAAAVAAARDCLVATQAPDSAALPAAQQKILECSTGNFGAQAALYLGTLTQTYQVADVHVQVSELRTAVERNYDDGSVDLLAAVRVKVDTNQAQGQEFGYRMRVKMAREDGQYKIASLDQVAK